MWINESTFFNNTAAGGVGGGIRGYSGNIELENSVVYSNTVSGLGVGGGGGGIFIDAGSLKLRNSSVYANFVSQNTALAGGGLYLATTSTITNSSIYSNSSIGFGGGIYSRGPLMLFNSTVASNTAAAGGGLYNANNATVEAVHVTLSHNRANDGGGLYTTVGASTLLSNTIVANSLTAGLFGGDINAAGVLTLSQVVSGVTPFGALQNNGGRTWTMSVPFGSPALDTGVDCPSSSTDQRGVTRPQSVSCDLGAYEALPMMALTATVAGTGSGTILSTPSGMSCGSVCATGFETGTVVTLSATPAFGSVLTGWLGICSGTGTCTVGMTSTHEVTAAFTLNTYTVTVSADSAAGGTVGGGGVVSHGNLVTVTATANAGYTFVAWHEGGAAVSASASYAFVATAHRTLVAHFVATPIETPIAVNDAAGTLQGDMIVIDPLKNDIYPSLSELTIVGVTQPEHGSVVVDGNAKTLTYAPWLDFSGLDSFLYTIQDPHGMTSTASVAVVVTAKTESFAPQVVPIDNTTPTTATFISAASEVVLELPPGSYNGAAGLLGPADIFYIAFKEVMTPTGQIAAPPGGLSFASKIFTLEAYFNQTRLDNYQFPQPVTFTVSYDPAALSNLTLETLQLFYWDADTQQWSQDGLTFVSHDRVNHTLTYRVAHFTEFSYFGNSNPTALEPVEEPMLNHQLYLPTIER